MVNRLKEKFSLRDLFFYILKRWYIIVVVTAVCGILGGLFLGRIREESVTGIDEIYEYSLSDSEISEVYEQICFHYDNQKKYKEILNYCDSSILQNIDPYHIPELTCTYRIETDDENDVKSICQKYCKELLDSDTYDLIREKVGWNCDDYVIRELISADYDIDIYSGFTVVVRASSEEDCRIILEVLDNRIKDLQSEIEKEFVYKIIEDSVDFAIIFDPDLNRKQIENVSRCASYKQYMNTAENYLATTTQREYYKYLLDYSNGILSDGTDQEYINAIEEARFKDAVELLEQRVSASNNTTNNSEGDSEEKEIEHFNLKNMLYGILLGLFISVVFIVLSFMYTSTDLIRKS